MRSCATNPQKANKPSKCAFVCWKLWRHTFWGCLGWVESGAEEKRKEPREWKAGKPLAEGITSLHSHPHKFGLGLDTAPRACRGARMATGQWSGEEGRPWPWGHSEAVSWLCRPFATQIHSIELISTRAQM
jgi:hypothetical protein